VPGVHSFKAIGAGWAVRSTGAARSTKTGLDETAAWIEAQRIAKAKGVAAYRHGSCGRIIERSAAEVC